MPGPIDIILRGSVEICANIIRYVTSNVLVAGLWRMRSSRL
jgi:hypothetical protein